MEFIFTKKGKIRFISHLDLMRMFMRAFRRARFPLKMSEGFSPHVKFSIERALKLGVESENEKASVVLKAFVKPQEFMDRLQPQLPDGIRVSASRLI
jgi:radical SAM-linked protein